MLFYQFGQVLRDDRRRRLPRLRLLLRGYTAQHQRGGTSHGLTRSDVGFESVSDDERLFLPCAEFFQGEFHQERKWLEIGRASWRERGEISVGGGVLKKKK